MYCNWVVVTVYTQYSTSGNHLRKNIFGAGKFPGLSCGVVCPANGGDSHHFVSAKGKVILSSIHTPMYMLCIMSPSRKAWHSGVIGIGSGVMPCIRNHPLHKQNVYLCPVGSCKRATPIQCVHVHSLTYLTTAIIM